MFKVGDIVTNIDDSSVYLKNTTYQFKVTQVSYDKMYFYSIERLENGERFVNKTLQGWNLIKSKKPPRNLPLWF